MSHVVGEVTYVELFKDAEGKSRVSDVANLLHEVLNALSRLSLISALLGSEPLGLTMLLNWRYSRLCFRA